MSRPISFLTLPLCGLLLSSALLAAPVQPSETEPDFDFWETPPASSGAEARLMNSINPSLPPTPAGPIKVAPKFAKDGRVLKVLIDPGHGGKDYGTRAASGLMEKRLSLRLATLVKGATKELLDKKGVASEVRLSRDDDSFLSLRDRTRLANSWEADLFISIHANSEPSGKARGFEVYFISPEGTDRRANQLALLENSEKAGTPFPSNPVIRMLADSQNSAVQNESSRFAEVMFDVMASYLESSVRAVRQAPFSVLSHTVMPSLLIEVGYLSHPKDTSRLKNPRYLKKVAGAISQGILEYTNRQASKRPSR